MSQSPENRNNPLKSWKYIIFPPIKSTDASAILMKCFLLACVLTSACLVSHSFFYASSANSKYLMRYFGGDNQSPIHPVNKYYDNATSIDHILFGIGGSAKTWNKRRKYNELWWKPNVTRGFVWLDEKPPENETWPETSPPCKVSEDTSWFKYSSGYGSRSAIRIARIVKQSFELGLDNVRWLVMGDDDTVFFTENLVTVLSRYDHNQMYYVGGISESVEQDVVHSYNMGYGGGGFAISYPLASQLSKLLDGCINRYASFYGSDQKIGACMMEIGVPIIRELGFHQVDIRGNSYGLLAVHPLAPLVSLHHLDYVQPLFPGMNRIDSVKKLVEAYESDPSRTLQQSICYDIRPNWSFSLSWGYTVQLYPSIVTAKDLTTPLQTFLTWRSRSQGPFTFNTRVYSLDPCWRPVVFYFDSVRKLLGGAGTTASYVRSPHSEKQCERKEKYKSASYVQMVNVSAAILDPDIWKKAPRRQCCEVVDGGDMDTVVHIIVRGCNMWESVTPP